jgi:CDP-diacylglycerol---glycerol-3-phosphate 3-phosphatidyltransferase
MSLQTLEQPIYLSSLRKQWAALSLISAVMAAGIFAWLKDFWDPGPAERWLLLSALLLLSFSNSLWRGLQYNYRAGETRLSPTLGSGNLLTLLRGFLIAALAGFLIVPRPPGVLAWLPGSLMVGITVTDLLDGYLARRANQATRLGEMLDMQFDGLSLLVSSSLLVFYRQAPVWFLLVGLARYLFLFGIFARQRMGKPVYELAPSPVRRPFAGVQMGFTAVLLFPLFSPPATHLAAALFALPFLAGFFLDWLVVSGVIPQAIQKEMRSVTRIKHFLLHWLPVGLRTILVAGLTLELLDLTTANNGSLPGGTNTVFLLTFGLLSSSAVLLAAGAAGRIAAALALVALGLQTLSRPPDGLDQVLIVLSTALFFLGTGAISIWKPEDRMIKKRFGEKGNQEA